MGEASRDEDCQEAPGRLRSRLERIFPVACVATWVQMGPHSRRGSPGGSVNVTRKRIVVRHRGVRVICGMMRCRGNCELYKSDLSLCPILCPPPTPTECDGVSQKPSNVLQGKPFVTLHRNW